MCGIVGADDVILRASSLAEYVMYVSCEGTDWAGDCAGSIMADDATSGTILLVGDAHVGSGSFGEGVEVGCVGYDCMVSSVEG